MKRLLCLLALLFCLPIQAGTLKGTVYNPDGTVAKTATITIDVFDTVSGNQLGSGTANSDGSYSVTFDSTKLSKTGTGANTIYARYSRSGVTTDLKGTSSATKVGGLFGGAITQTVHAVVAAD